MTQALPHIARWILTFEATHEYLVYTMIVVVACVEGPWLSIILGFLIRLGDFSVFPVYISLMLGDLIGDAVWYYIGRRYGDRFVAKYGKYFNVTARGVERMSTLFHRYKHSVLFLSKISNGLGFALVTLMTAGMVEFLSADIWRSTYWVSLYGPVCFSLSDTSSVISTSQSTAFLDGCLSLPPQSRWQQWGTGIGNTGAARPIRIESIRPEKQQDTT